MKLTSASFEHQGRIDPQYAFCRSDPESHATFSANHSPQLSWSELPEGCRSLALICVDPDAPSVGDDVNQEGRTVSKDLPRADFHHWVMVDIAPSVSGLAAGECSGEVTPGGKQSPAGPEGVRQGINDYTSWFSGDAQMGGDYLGYDGPAPPWNDERVHRYHFQLYALDLERLGVEGRFTAADVRQAMEGHVLAEAELVGTYTLNPALA